MNATHARIVLGKLVKAVGLRGELKLYETSDFWSEALRSAQLFLVRDDARRAVHVRRWRVHSPGMTALFVEGVDDREGAEACIGFELVLEGETLDVPLPETRRPFQVRGVRVLLPDGSQLGTVDDVMPMPAQDVFVVQGEREYLIPDAPHVVRELDLDARIMRIDPLPGLLEL